MYEMRNGDVRIVRIPRLDGEGVTVGDAAVDGEEVTVKDGAVVAFDGTWVMLLGLLVDVPNPGDSVPPPAVVAIVCSAGDKVGNVVVFGTGETLGSLGIVISALGVNVRFVGFRETDGSRVAVIGALVQSVLGAGVGVCFGLDNTSLGARVALPVVGSAVLVVGDVVSEFIAVGSFEAEGAGASVGTSVAIGALTIKAIGASVLALTVGVVVVISGVGADIVIPGDGAIVPPVALSDDGAVVVIPIGSSVVGETVGTSVGRSFCCRVVGSAVGSRVGSLLGGSVSFLIGCVGPLVPV